MVEPKFQETTCVLEHRRAKTNQDGIAYFDNLTVLDLKNITKTPNTKICLTF